VKERKKERKKEKVERREREYKRVSSAIVMQRSSDNVPLLTGD
jgi:hypothetical protein